MGLPKVTDITIVIPSLNPDDKLIGVIDKLLHNGFTKIVIVDDGSDCKHAAPFDYALEKGCELLVHKVNKGKGRALKTAFDHCMKDKECVGVITVDGDGQHGIEDIFLCGLKMISTGKVVLGCRDFSQPQVPFKSKYGNNITKFAFKALCGISISDTQTGLRAIPIKYLPFMMGVVGERFEYETNMLLMMKSIPIPWVEQKIQTIYIDENASSHFKPFQDSWKIYKLIFKYSFGRLAKYVLSSGLSAIIDICLFYTLLLLMDTEKVGGIVMETAVATIGARVVSSVCNYLLNRNVVFKAGSKNSVLKYYALCCVQLISSALLVSLASIITTPNAFWETMIKLLIDTMLFFVSYQVQKNWVFGSKSCK